MCLNMANVRKQKGEDFKKEDILQAVVIADSFDEKFAPITWSKPRALLPLANIPLLEYTLEFLASAGIQEIIVFCCSHASQIKDYLKRSSWLSPSSPVDVITIVSENCLSLGDALRDIDAKSLISNDFILVNGDLVANVRLKSVLEQHKARRAKDKTVMMTLLFQKVPPCHTIRKQQNGTVLAIGSENNRILSYQKADHKTKFHLPLGIFTDKKSVQLRYDLMDTGICVCSPHVCELFTDNFDYQTKDGFVRGILIDEEIMNNKIYIHVLDNEYAARVSNQHMYDAISKDVLKRWVYPIVPDGPPADSTSDRCSYGRHNIYLHKDVTLARGCKLQQNVLIGQGSSVGNNTDITDSVIGRNCVIGNGVKLADVYIWDGVHIGDNCQLSLCIIDNNVQLKNNVTVKPGCIIASKVVVGPNVTLPEGCRFTIATQSKDKVDTIKASKEVIGEDGLGYIYIQPEDNLDEETDEKELKGESDEETDSMLGDSEDESTHPMLDDSEMFLDEVLSTLQRALSENTSCDNMVLEVNSVKHAYGIQIKEVNHLLIKAVMVLPLKSESPLEPPAYLKQLISNLKKFQPLLSNYIRSEESQMHCLQSIEECCVCNAIIRKVIVKVIHHLYEADILSEEAILTWHSSQLAEDEKEKKSVRVQVDPFIQWLKEAEEESDDESD